MVGHHQRALASSEESTASRARGGQAACLKTCPGRADNDAMAAGSWLCRDDMDRARMLDMERRIAPVRAAAMGSLGVALIACGPWLGWWTLAPLALAALGFRIVEPRLEGLARPEYALLAAWATSEVAIAVSVALSGGTRTPTMAWFAIPVVTLSSPGRAWHACRTACSIGTGTRVRSLDRG